MSVKLVPTSQIKVALGIEPNGRVEKFLASTCAKHMDKYVPFDTGTLADTVRIDGNMIIYKQNYADYVYKGISHSGNPLNYQRDKHPLANSYWDKRMMSAEKEKVVKEVQDYIRKRGI